METEDKCIIIVDGQEVEIDRNSYLGRVKQLVGYQDAELFNLISELENIYGKLEVQE